jgi:hypothetical protein
LVKTPGNPAFENAFEERIMGLINNSREKKKNEDKLLTLNWWQNEALE